MSASEILEEFRRLPFDEQCELAQRIADELRQDLDEETKARFESRAERLRGNPDAGFNWEIIRAELEQRLKQLRP